jgi:hypothetical protein
MSLLTTIQPDAIIAGPPLICDLSEKRAIIYPLVEAHQA